MGQEYRDIGRVHGGAWTGPCRLFIYIVGRQCVCNVGNVKTMNV